MVEEGCYSLQEVFEAQGYIVVASKEDYPVGAVLTDVFAKMTDTEPFGICVVITKAERIDWINQSKKYWPQDSLDVNWYYQYFVKVVAE